MNVQCNVFCQKMEKMDVDMKTLEPGLWGNLPKELLLLVFSHLSASGISQLRLLSKDWKRNVDTDSEFSRLLNETVYPRMFGLIAGPVCIGVGRLWAGGLFDGKSDRWHSFEIFVGDVSHTMVAADGGLICCVSERAMRPLSIVVSNPLIGKHVELPFLLGMEGARPTTQPVMVQLIMDSQKQHYKVFVAGYMKQGRRDPFAQVYDSKVKEWTIVGLGQQSWDRIHGCERLGETYYCNTPWGPCVYDFKEGRLQDFGASNIVEGPLVLTFAVWKNRLFVFQEQECAGAANLASDYCISEYQFQKNANVWVKVETHECIFVNDYLLRDYKLLIHACNGFLILLTEISPAWHDDLPTDGGRWLYDLSTHEWRNLPAFRRVNYENSQVELMCKLRWDAMP